MPSCRKEEPGDQIQNQSGGQSQDDTQNTDLSVENNVEQINQTEQTKKIEQEELIMKEYTEVTGNHMFSPGDIFWEKTYNEEGWDFVSCIGVDQPQKRICDFNIDLDNRRLSGSLRAEIAIEYWGGHIGTSEQQFKINDSDWYDIPQPVDTPTKPQTYFRMGFGNPPVEIPLTVLKSGKNRIQVKAGKQIKYGWDAGGGFDGGFYWIYAVTVRIYYKSDKIPALTIPGRIVSPSNGEIVGENPVITVEVDDTLGTVKSIDLIGRYKHYDWTGTGGGYNKWYYTLNYGRMFNHIGRIENNYLFTGGEKVLGSDDEWQITVPYSMQWDTSYLPDQDTPVAVMAKITNQDNVSYITDTVEFIFARENRSVKMYEPSKVPEYFSGHFWNQKNGCVIEMPDSLDSIERAWIIMSNWSFAHAMEIGFNDTVVASNAGYVHNFSYARIEIPVELIKKTNKVSVFNDAQNHPAEVNWPGPCLFIERKK
jgi:hypothetical protein